LSSSSDFHGKKQSLQEKGQDERFNFHIIIHGRKTTFFVESSDNDNLESLSECCFRNYKEDNKIRTRKLALKNTKYFGALQRFSLCTYQWFAPGWGVGQPRGIGLRKAHMGWDFDITAIPRVGNLT